MCDTLAIVEGGRVLFAKNSDRDPNEAQLLEWHGRAEHGGGEHVECTWISIPQVRVTFATVLSRPFWMWGAEIGTNEFGVTIGNEAVFTNQPYASTGLTGMDLLRLGLERAETAKAACEVITSLLEEHGQGGGCGHENRGFTYHNSYIVADRTTAFVLETAGRLWAIEEIAGARSISNGLTISGFAEEHSDFIKTRGSSCRVRQSRTLALAKGSSGVGDLFRILRDHGEGAREPQYAFLNGGMGAPCMHAGGVAAASQTTGSWVAELGADGDRHWVTGTAAPCTGLFKPIRVDAPIDLGAGATDRADGESLWWRHERFHRMVMRNPTAAYPVFVDKRDALEAKWLGDVPGSADAFAEGDRRLGAWTEAVGSLEVADVRPVLVRRYWGKRSGWARV
jgi:dipeptidase